MLIAGPSSRLAAVVAVALVLACKRGGDAPRPATPEPQPTIAQRDARAPGERSTGFEESRRADRHRRAAARPGAIRRIEGTLEESSGGRVIIRAPGDERVTLRIAGGTAITVDGRTASIEALRAGAGVRASYEPGRSRRPTALSIEARSPPPPRREPRPADGPLPDAYWVPNTGERGSDGGG